MPDVITITDNTEESYTLSDRPATLPIGPQAGPNIWLDAKGHPCVQTPDGWRLCAEASVRRWVPTYSSAMIDAIDVSGLRKE